MLLDVNSATGSCDCGKYFDAHSIPQCIAYLCMLTWAISVEYLIWLWNNFQGDLVDWIVWLLKLCAFYSSVSYIFLYAPLVNSSRITHIMMTPRSISLAPWRRNQQGTIHSCQNPQPVLPSYRHWVSSASFVTVNLRANTLLTVTAVSRHSLARSVQTQGASDHYIWQNARMFRLEFLAITVLPP